MVQTQTKEDKERFFADLERLATSDSETESDGDEALYYNFKTGTFNHNRVPEPKPSLNQPIPINRCKTKSPSRPAKKSETATSSIKSSKKPAPVVIDLTSPDATLTSNTTTLPKAQSPTKNSKKRKHSEPRDVPSKKRVKKSKYDVVLVPENERVFKDLVFFFIPTDDIPKTRKIRIQRAREYGAQRATVFDETVTHVIVEPHIEYAEISKAFPNRHVPDGTTVVSAKWLSECIDCKWLRDVDQSRFKLKGQLQATGADTLLKPVTPVQPIDKRSRRSDETPKRIDPDSPELSKEFESIIAQVKARGSLLLDEEPDLNDSFSNEVPESSLDASVTAAKDDVLSGKPVKGNKGFQCMEANLGNNGDNPNANTIAILQEMATYYDRTGDHWRTTAYRKAISSLRKQTVLVATREQALSIPQIGTRLADKIEEIVTTNRLRRLENIKDDPQEELLQVFMGIYGVGHKQASQWIAQGHRTLGDLLNHAKLSTNQRIGIEHYTDFQQRIPRWEVSQHGSVVRHAIKAVDKKMDVIVGGSFRRGNMESGDIDLIITKPAADMAYIRTIMNSQVIPALTKAGFLKCALASSHGQSSSGSKWLGASCISTSKTWRRIDLLFVPGDELGAALIYFTGNDIFNRSIRLLASKKGMRLNQHGLYKDVMRGEGRTKITDGTLVESKDERRIFEILGVPWREPHERKC